MSCAASPPVDGPGWAEVARCLARRGLPEAATRAWSRAWEADPELADQALPAALALAHQTGDDRLVVAIAGARPDLADEDALGHLAYARADHDPGATELLSSVPFGSCRYPYAQLLLSARLDADGKLKSEVLALREVIEAAEAASRKTYGPAPLWSQGALVGVAELRVADVYAGLRRPDRALHYADRDDPFGGAVAAWAELQTGDRDAAIRDAEAVQAAVPEVSAILVAARTDPAEREALASAAHARWDPVRASLEGLVARYADHPEGAPEGLLSTPVASNGAVRTDGLRADELDREARRTRHDSAAAALVGEARAELDRAYGLALVAAARHGMDRIDAALDQSDRVAGTVATTVTPHLWTLADLGW